ncbi:MAG: oxidoreductase [Pararhizobium sp.]
MPSTETPVWFITGCSTGFGRELAHLVLERGWKAAVTARDKARVADLVAGAGDRAVALDLDVTDPADVKAAAEAAEGQFGRIDVLVNNAGYGYQASVEEGDEAEIRALFEANVFGLFAMTRAVLPGMRRRRHGHVINITSLAGLAGFASSGYYAASKHAVEGFSDSLAAEVGPLGIKVTCVEPGPFRTDWAGRSLRQTPSRIDDYAETAAARMAGTSGISGKQVGDPVRAAKAMLAITEEKDPPRNFALGATALKMGEQRLREKLHDMETWRSQGLATDFPD